MVLRDALWQRPQVQGITIDGADSLDLDDAIWVEPTDTGAIISVHVTDVAELVLKGSALDCEAITRTQSLYFRTGKTPMLPQALSEHKLSLLEWQQRPTLTVQIKLGAMAQVEQVDIFESWLASAKKFSYAKADAVLADPTSPYYKLLSGCQFWSGQLNHHRRSAGGMGGMVSAAGLWVDEDGRLLTTAAARYHSHHIIQEFMILANTVVAQWLATADCLALYRNHQAKAIAPDQNTMWQVLLTLGSPAAIRQQLQNWLHPAEYSPTLIGHFALNLPTYCHFTSPLRRCADLINHRIVKARLHDRPLPYSKPELEALSQGFNRFIQERDAQTKAYFKTQHHQQYQTQLQDPQVLSQLSAKDFGRVLKYAAQSERMDGIEAEVITRLTAGTLQNQDLYMVLFHGGKLAVQHRVLQHLAEAVQDATSVIMIAGTQQDDWQDIDYVESEQGPPFAAWLEVNLSGQVQTTAHAGISPKKQGARHQASWAWLAAYVQGTLVSPAERIEPQFPKVAAAVAKAPPKVEQPLKATQNCISRLNHLCQSQTWQKPDYAFTAIENGFRCECQFWFENAQIVGTGTATSKRKAKEQAACQVLESIPVSGVSLP